ncbi:hypothetical protein NOCA2140026 [metagenome]|uniref:Uncharacterized protein n=1 Tax=metagenome TaxID=256318 RepID=A0A2P2BWV0_9ZZZZ
MEDDNLLIRVGARTSAKRAAAETIAAVDSGRSVTWLFKRDTHSKPIFAALGDWKAPYGTVSRVGHGQTVAYFSNVASGQMAHTFWHHN